MRNPLDDGRDGFIRDLVRDHHADADLSPAAADRLRRELEHGFERQRVRRRRAGTGLATALVLVVSLLAWRTDVISQALDVVLDKINSLGRPTLVSRTTGERYGSPLDSTATMEEHRALAQKAHEAKMAGAWRVTWVTGWTLRGVTCFGIEYKVEIDGQVYRYHNMSPEILPEGWAEDLGTFERGAQPALVADIRAGTAESVAPDTLVVFGSRYVFDRYRTTDPDLGEVIMWIAGPPD